MQVSLTKSAEVLKLYHDEDPMWTNYLLFARVFGMSRAEFEQMTEDEIFATVAYVKEYGLFEK